MSYPFRQEARTPHHACAFAPTVWTNVYFRSAFILFGDIIGGEVSPLLGPGIEDIRLRIGGPVFRHLDYWKDPAAEPPNEWIVALRRAVNLRQATTPEGTAEQLVE